MPQTSKDAPNPNHTSSTRQTLSREDEADLELRHTAFSPGAARCLVAAFLLLIFVPPALQNLLGAGARRNAASVKKHKGKEPITHAAQLLPTAREMAGVRGIRSAVLLLPGTGEMKQYETYLEETSLVSNWILPRAQNVLTGVLRVGNEQAYTGKPGWLFYRPEVEYLTGRGFLDPAVLHPHGETPTATPAGVPTAMQAEGKADKPAKTQTAAQLQLPQTSAAQAPVSPQRDPVRGIVHFKRQLQKRGIALLVVPVPSKLSIHPEKLSPRYAATNADFTGQAGGERTPENPSFEPFKQALQKEGVAVFDPAPILRRARQLTGQTQYLPADTHWTPAAMESVARALATRIRTEFSLPARKPVRYRRRRKAESNISDLELMLKLPRGQKLFPRQHVTVQRVLTPQGKIWYSRPDCDILILGDSFTNIYAAGGYWGRAAGLAEQLSFFLQRPLDRIAINGGGASETRHKLLEKMRRGDDRLRNKRLVIYQFATRTLLNGDWKLIDFPPAARRRPSTKKAVKQKVARKGAAQRIAETTKLKRRK